MRFVVVATIYLWLMGATAYLLIDVVVYGTLSQALDSFLIGTALGFAVTMVVIFEVVHYLKS